MSRNIPFTIPIPHTNLAGAGADMRSRLVTWEWRTKLPKDCDHMVLDFRENRFIEPWALGLYTAYALRMKRDTGRPVYAELDLSKPANQYVEKMGIKHVLGTGKSTPDWDKSQQNTGLHVIRNHGDVTRFVNSASQLGPGPDDETVDALKYGMAELGRNVVQHAHSNVGGVAIAQYFPDRKAIQISVCDCGQGIIESLRGQYPEIQNDLEALKLAVLPHVSGAFPVGAYSASENAGLGLFFVKEICWRSDGSFWLVSGRYLLGVKEHDAEGKNRIYRSIRSWEGTAVTMDIPASGVGDFEELLKTCRTLASQARECSGTAGLDFINEVPDLPDVEVMRIDEFSEDVGQASRRRDETILPRLKAGELVIMDFRNVRFATQSFIHALLNDAFKTPGSLCRLSFVNCTGSTQEAIRTVAAYAASYRLSV
jgi:hypothetical protein